MSQCEFIGNDGAFRLEQAEGFRNLYFPLAGEYGLKSAVTPNLGGDAKLDQNHFLYQPVSSIDLNGNRFARNFWVVPEEGEPWSALGASTIQRADTFTDREEKLTVEAGFMFHRTILEGRRLPLEARTEVYVPTDKNLEVIKLTLKNTGREAFAFSLVSAIPLYGRSADNIRDHRHVTSLLNRVSVKNSRIELKPTLSFDERGHQVNHASYFAFARDKAGNLPIDFYVNQESFTGEGGDFERPEALLRREKGVGNGYEENGCEAMAGFRFEKQTLEPGQTAEWYFFQGICYGQEEEERMLSDFRAAGSVEREMDLTRQYWKKVVNVKYHSKDERFDRFMDWVSFQPELRRLFGCSFLPHHDYGKGGRGWRDLWQDCLALLIMNPANVRQMLLSNFSGVRIDGSNATIIGERLGEFKADRNSITRVWMDHGVWPLMTTELYLNQTGDYELLFEEAAYFKDGQAMRGNATDPDWKEEKWQLTLRGKEYRGSILEHLLLQNLTAFWEVGDHNHIRLRDADWNDALDMASEKGESVAFTNAYGRNLVTLASLIEELGEEREILLLQEMDLLLAEGQELYENPQAKQKVLLQYEEKIRHSVSGVRQPVDAGALAENLRKKGQWILEHVRASEWIDASDEEGWFNGYYDNDGNALEGIRDQKAHMTLTGQVFAIMAGTATDEQISKITKAADHYLYDEDCGGYRLNTDFEELKTNMGRMFGFAYGEKENGAVFSHMAVMYANALYQRGFAREGYRSLKALYSQSMDFEKSHIYPGIPEYFGRGGRGLYHFLTGAASWYMLTVVNEMYGVRGEKGNLLIQPKLLAEQFDDLGKASLQLKFSGRSLEVEYQNAEELEYGSYQIKAATLDDRPICPEKKDSIVISRDRLKDLNENEKHRLVIQLG